MKIHSSLFSQCSVRAASPPVMPLHIPCIPIKNRVTGPSPPAQGRRGRRVVELAGTDTSQLQIGKCCIWRESQPDPSM